MIASPQLVLFAITAGVKLGRKIYDVLVDETAERPMLLPLGDLFGNVQDAEATQFFLREENVQLIKEGGPSGLRNDGALGIMNGLFTLRASAAGGQVLVIQARTNLVNWVDNYTNTTAGGSFDFSDPDTAQFPKRFYRALGR